MAGHLSQHRFLFRKLSAVELCEVGVKILFLLPCGGGEGGGRSCGAWYWASMAGVVAAVLCRGRHGAAFLWPGRHVGAFLWPGRHVAAFLWPGRIFERAYCLGFLLVL